MALHATFYHFNPMAAPVHQLATPSQRRVKKTAFKGSLGLGPGSLGLRGTPRQTQRSGGPAVRRQPLGLVIPRPRRGVTALGSCHAAIRGVRGATHALEELFPPTLGASGKVSDGETERACKPDSVPARSGWVAAIPLGRLLPTASSDAPEGLRGPRALSLVLLQVGFAEHPCHHECWCADAPFSPFPASLACWSSLFCGTFPRSLEAAVSGHLALWSPDFPPGSFLTRAAARPSP